MTKFEYFSVPRIIFGSGSFARIGELAAPMGKRAAVIFNGSDEIIQKLKEHLLSTNIQTMAIRQRGEPTVTDIDAAVLTARAGGCDMVIGIGGGSAIDAAKAVAGLLTNPGSALDYLEVVGKGQKIAKMAAPWIAIPTTAGTGAEATRNAVVGVPERNFKASLRSELLLARIALIDPELSVAVSPQVTARTGMDALCQCIEAYTSSGAGPLTEGIALEGITRAARSLAPAFHNGRNLAAREDMALAALHSGIALANAGLGAVHGFAAPMGASFPVPHGTVCAILLAPVMRANVAALRSAGGAAPLKKYAEVGRRLTASAGASDDAAIDAGIAFVERLCQELQIEKLGKFGVNSQNVPAVVALAQKASSMKFNPITLPETVLTHILLEVL